MFTWSGTLLVKECLDEHMPRRSRISETRALSTRKPGVSAKIFNPVSYPQGARVSGHHKRSILKPGSKVKNSDNGSSVVYAITRTPAFFLIG